MNDIIFDDRLLDELLAKAAENPRLRVNYDLRNSEADSSQRMLNALQPGTQVPVHSHPGTSETVVVLRGRVVEVFYDGAGRETSRHLLDPAKGRYGMSVPAGQLHALQAEEPSVIVEFKDGPYIAPKP